MVSVFAYFILEPTCSTDLCTSVIMLVFLIVLIPFLTYNIMMIIVLFSCLFCVGLTLSQGLE